MDSKQNSARRSLNEGSNRKVRLASNMYMFKVRAFQDILKTRNGNSAASQRHFKYNVEEDGGKKKNKKKEQVTQTEDGDNNTSQEQSQHGKKQERLSPRPSPRPSPKASHRASPRHSPRRSPKPSTRPYLSPSHQQSVEDASQQLRYLSCSQLRQRYKNLNVLCQEQLLVLHETKSLLQRQTTRNTILSQNYDLAHRQSLQLRQQLTAILQKFQQQCHHNHQLQQKLKEQTHLRQQLQHQIHQLNNQANHTQNDIILLKRSMETYQVELQHVTNDKSQQINNLQQQIQQLKQHITQIQQQSATQKHQLSSQKCQIQSQLLSFKNSHQLQLEHKDNQVKQLQCKLECLISDMANLEKQHISQKNAKTLEINNIQSYVNLLQQQKEYIQKEYDVIKSLVERQRRLLTERETERDRIIEENHWNLQNLEKLQQQHQQLLSKYNKLRQQNQQLSISSTNFQQQLSQLTNQHTLLQHSNSTLQSQLASLNQHNHHLQHLLTTSRNSIVSTLQCGRQQIEKQRKLFNEIADQNFTLRCRISQLQK